MMLLFLACSASDAPTLYIAPDLTQPLDEGEVRAGEVIDEAALFGGVSAEGRLGDFKLYNSRARFIVQGLRDGDYYVQQPGGVIDADAVRAEGAPGRDLVDDLVGMFGIGRLLDAQTITVLDDGAISGRAVICAEGPEGPMELISGALESPDFIPDLGLWIRTEYILEVDSPLLEVVSTITASEDATFEPGDLLLGSLDLGRPWTPGSGLEGDDQPTPLSGFVEDRDGVALALLAAPGEQLEVPLSASLLQSLTDMVVGFGPAVDLAAGESATYRRFYGAASDLAQISDAWLERSGWATETLEGQVTAPDGPVAGARVNVMAGDTPWTLAITDAEGNFRAQVPAEGDWSGTPSAAADGRGTGLFTELPVGAGSYSTHAAPSVREATLALLAGQGEEADQVQGRGAADPSAPLTLGEPARLTLTASDGLPFEARLLILDAETETDPRLVRERPRGGSAALGWSRDGEMTLAVEPGSYHLIAWRGLRYELHEADLTLAAGETQGLEFSLPAAYAHEDWIFGDFHVHAAPSNDATVTLEERAVVMAALGVQLLVGTDHDHVTDYAPLVEALGLSGLMATLTAEEFSPPLRGHVNTYPLSPIEDMVNRGATLWWRDLQPDTQAWFDRIAETHPGALYQLNHPMDSGVAELADWSPGVIGSGDRWPDHFDAVEVLNDGKTEEYLAFWWDVFLRGVLSAPVGVSDSHTHTSGNPGINGTFIGIDGGFAGYTEAGLVDAIQSRRTVVSLGPFLSQSIEPGSTVTGSATLSVEALSPSWIVVDRLQLVRDGEVVSEVEGTQAQFELAPEADAAYAVMAVGDTAMAPLFGELPWAMSSPVLVDVEGDGWEHPLPALQIEE